MKLRLAQTESNRSCFFASEVFFNLLTIHFKNVTLLSSIYGIRGLKMKRTEYNGKEFAFPFVAYTPEKSEGSLPLIIQLHGAGERGNGDLDLMDVHGFSHLLKRKDYPAVFVMPQCPKDQFWAGRVESLGAFVRQLLSAFPVDEKRVYLCGLSMGGFGTWYTAMAYPHLFAAIAPCCGGGMPWNAKVLTMPVFAIHGVDDPLVKVSNSDDMVEALEKLGREVIYKRLPGVGHNSWDHSFDGELVEWLLSKSL